MTIKDFDTIEVVQDLPEKNIWKGMRGTVIDVFTTPNLAYETEFCEDNGTPVVQVPLLPKQVKKIEFSAPEEYKRQGGSRLHLMKQ